jgi:hypothetical protein
MAITSCIRPITSYIMAITSCILMRWWWYSSFAWTDRGSNPRCTSLRENTLTITPPMQSTLKGDRNIISSVLLWEYVWAVNITNAWFIQIFKCFDGVFHFIFHFIVLYNPCFRMSIYDVLCVWFKNWMHFFVVLLARKSVDRGILFALYTNKQCASVHAFTRL